MKGRFRVSMAWLHTWAGLCFGWALFVIMFAGTLAVFERPITEWMQAPPPIEVREALVAAAGGGEEAEFANSYRHSEGGRHFVRLHFTFHADLIGIWVVGAVAMAMFVGLITGVIIHARIFRDFFTFRPGKGHRSWLDAHVALGVTTLPFLLMIAYSGLVLFYATYMPAGVMARYGENTRPFNREINRSVENPPPMPEYPTIVPKGMDLKPMSTLRQQFIALHVVGFGGAAMKWIYFFSGLAGTALVAIGQVLYVVKRSKKHAGEGETRGLILAVEKLNCATIAGFCVASAGFFWANRLIPLDVAERSGVELKAFAAIWVLCVLHAAFRPPAKAWREQFALAAALCLGLPALNALTSDISLFNTIAKGEWQLASLDLAALAFGFVFAGIAWALARPRVRARPEPEPEGAPVHGV